MLPPPSPWILPRAVSMLPWPLCLGAGLGQLPEPCVLLELGSLTGSSRLPACSAVWAMCVPRAKGAAGSCQQLEMLPCTARTLPGSQALSALGSCCRVSPCWALSSRQGSPAPSQVSALQVDELKAKLAAQEVELKQKNEDADKLIQVVGVETEKVSRKKAVADEEERKVALIAQEVEQKQKDCEEDLAKAEPALAAAQAALNTLNKVG